MLPLVSTISLPVSRTGVVKTRIVSLSQIVCRSYHVVFSFTELWVSKDVVGTTSHASALADVRRMVASLGLRPAPEFIQDRGDNIVTVAPTRPIGVQCVILFIVCSFA